MRLLQGMLSTLALSVLTLSVPCVHSGQRQRPPSQDVVPSCLLDRGLEDFLRKRLEAAGSLTDVSYRDLNGDGAKEFVVYVTGPDLCGSGGCTAFIIEASDPGSYRVITKLTVTRLPIKALRETSHGWRRITVRVSDRDRGEYTVRLTFDGVTYPNNPSVAPAQEIRSGYSGVTVVSESQQPVSLRRGMP
jgi:hypothetical protein